MKKSIDKRSTTMIDTTKVCYLCLGCGKRFTAEKGHSKICRNCLGELVIDSNLLVLK